MLHSKTKQKSLRDLISRGLLSVAQAWIALYLRYRPYLHDWICGITAALDRTQ